MVSLRKDVCVNADLCLRYTLLLLKGWLENSTGMGMDGGYAPVLLLHLSIALWVIRFQLAGSLPGRYRWPQCDVFFWHYERLLGCVHTAKFASELTCRGHSPDNAV